MGGCWRSLGEAWPAAGLCFLLAAAMPLSPQSKSPPSVLARIGEVTPGQMVSEETCAIVYLDGSYHSERIGRKINERPTVDVYEGLLKAADLSQLHALLEAKEFQELKSPEPPTRGLVIEDLHLLQITVPRARGVQDVQYLTRASRKGDEPILKPLLKWWKGFRAHLSSPVKNGTRNRCQSSSTLPR